MGIIEAKTTPKILVCKQMVRDSHAETRKSGLLLKPINSQPPFINPSTKVRDPIATGHVLLPKPKAHRETAFVTLVYGPRSLAVSHNRAYLIRRNGICHFRRRVPPNLHTRFNKERVTILLRTRPFNKADKSPEAFSDCLGRY